MSLKAKIEAVIYASEEPVTLAQLAGLLGQEAQQELDRLDARQQRLHLAGEQQEQPDDDREELQPEPEIEPAPIAQDAAPAEPSSDEAAPAADETAKIDDAAEKRNARDRERKVREFLREVVAELVQDYATSDRGLEVREVAGGFRMATKPEYHDAVRGFVKSLKPPLKLSLQALETLAVVAYKQPVTAPEISEIRGVDSGGVLGSLMTRKLIQPAGRKQVIGRPILYKTTKDFLLRFGLKDVNELPSIEEFEKMAGELAEQEEIPMTHEDQEPIAHETEPQADGDSTSLDSDEDTAADAVIPGEEKAMPETDFEAPDSVPEDAPTTIATPEGDNEFAPDEPLQNLPDDAEQVPRGSEPDGYRQD